MQMGKVAPESRRKKSKREIYLAIEKEGCARPDTDKLLTSWFQKRFREKGGFAAMGGWALIYSHPTQLGENRSLHGESLMGWNM